MKLFDHNGRQILINCGEYVITGNASLSLDTEEESIVLTINQEELPKDEVYLSPDAKYQIPRRLLREIKQSLFTTEDPIGVKRIGFGRKLERYRLKPEVMSEVRGC